MTDAVCFVAVVVRQDGGACAYGPYTAQVDAERVCTLLGFTEATVVATRAVTLTPPQHGASAGNTNTAADEAIEVPGDLVPLLLADTEVPSSGPVVVLVLGEGVPHPARVVGVFPLPADAHHWITAAAGNTTTPSEKCVLLPVQPLHSDLATGSEDDGGELPAVVVLDTTAGCVTYGPFADSLHATAYWHDITSALHLTNVHHVYCCQVYPLSVLDELTPQPPAPTVWPHAAADGALWVLLLASADAPAPVVLGWFPDPDTAANWWTRHAPWTPETTATPIPVRQP